METEPLSILVQLKAILGLGWMYFAQGRNFHQQIDPQNKSESLRKTYCNQYI